jgi:DMSO/TMAO reductase YedYZ molybdopterin-dependent catalytic subunit
MWSLVESATQGRFPPALSDATLSRTVPLGRFDGRPAPPFGTLLGTSLDARQFTDLSALGEDTLITPTDKFYIRTARSPAFPSSWVIHLGGSVRRPQSVLPDALTALVRPMGVHLMECAGNTDPANFGLLSAARWEGVPLNALIGRLQPIGARWRVRVTGLDHDGPSRSSVPGASWVFSVDDLNTAGAFLATKMNDSVLTLDHGYPVRLVVPGWYGCASIKWVSRIDVVPDDEPATSQMREFAVRTHQDGTPALAREFVPATIDLAATPVRVEQWLARGRVVYRVVGVMWGGQTPTNRLQIRFRHTQPWADVEDCALPDSTRTWSLWSQLWQPGAPGRYQIVLRASDPTIRMRRLDAFFYTREVEIDRV